MIILTKLFEQQCVLLHILLNQGELYSHSSFIGLNDADFNVQCISNANVYFLKRYHQKITVK